jgi:hypothetical protein
MTRAELSGALFVAVVIGALLASRAEGANPPPGRRRSALRAPPTSLIRPLGGRTARALIHPIAWKGDSQKLDFRFTACRAVRTGVQKELLWEVFPHEPPNRATRPAAP